MKPLDQPWSIAQSIGLATILEASAPKLGNVPPGASFSDMHFGHFVASAAAVSQVFEKVSSQSVGQLILGSVQATRRSAGCNTNLGTILLLAPLAKAASTLLDQAVGSLPSQPTEAVGIDRRTLQQSVSKVLKSLTPDDSRLVYEAIRTAQPSGLGTQPDNDLSQSAPPCLLEAMQQVADVDAVARQYVNDYADIFQRLLPWLETALIQQQCPLKAILRLQLQTMAWQPDGLIIRKCGWDQARHVQNHAQEVLTLAQSGYDTTHLQLLSFDQFLRSDSNRLNPGTTADLIAATLFCKLVCG